MIPRARSGAVCASDLTLSGHEVRYTILAEQKDPGSAQAGGLSVEADANHLSSTKQVFARRDKVYDTTAKPLKDAEAVLIERDMQPGSKFCNRPQAGRWPPAKVR